MTKLKAFEFSSKVCLCQAHINLHDTGRSKISLLFAVFMTAFLTNSFKYWTVGAGKPSDLCDGLLIWTTWYCPKLWKQGYTKEHYCNYSIRNPFNYSGVLITWAFNIVLNMIIWLNTDLYGALTLFAGGQHRQMQTSDLILKNWLNFN